MSILALLVGAGLLLAGGFLAGFVWAVRSGQFDDTTTPAVRVLMDGDGEVPLPTPATPRRRRPTSFERTTEEEIAMRQEQPR